MTAEDRKLFEDLRARIEALETRVQALERAKGEVVYSDAERRELLAELRRGIPPPSPAPRPEVKE